MRFHLKMWVSMLQDALYSFLVQKGCMPEKLLLSSTTQLQLSLWAYSLHPFHQRVYRKANPFYRGKRAKRLSVQKLTWLITGLSRADSEAGLSMMKEYLLRTRH